MDLLASISLPHWLMIAGSVLVAVGFLGLVFTRNRQAPTSPDEGPTEPGFPIAKHPRTAADYAREEMDRTLAEHRRLVELGLKVRPPR